MKYLLILLFGCFLNHSFAQSTLSEHYQAAKAAYEQKDYPKFLLHTKKADSLSPNHPTITYNLAAAYAINDNYTKSLELIKKVVLMNTRLMPLEDDDFTKIKELEEFKSITELYNELQNPISNSELAFEIGELDLHPESIAYNPFDNTFLISSVHKNKIVEYNPKLNTVADWKNTGEDGLWAVMGMKVDKDNGHLWACVVATKEMDSYDQSLEGKTAVLQFDLSSKTLLNRYELTGGHWFGDLVIGPNNGIYISDSMKPIIYQVKNGKLEKYINLETRLFNLQGICLNSDNSLLYIADYKLGLFVLNLESKIIQQISHPDNMSSKGVDGLYFHNGTLIAIQNGVKPFRVSQFALNETGVSIENFKYIDLAREELGEPTLGVIVEDELYYIANSPWGAYDKEGNFNSESLKPNIILKTKLK